MRGELSLILPSLDTPSAPTVAAQHERYRSHRAVRARCFSRRCGAPSARERSPRVVTVRDCEHRAAEGRKTAWLRVFLGRLDEARDALEGAVEGARLLGNDQALAWGLIPLSDAAHAAGDLELALASAEEAAALVEGLSPGPFMRAGAAVARARALAALGKPERAVDLLVTSCGGEELTVTPAVARPRALELLTRCLLAVGKRREAERAANAAAECAESVSLGYARAMAELAAAALADDDGDHAAAADRALSAAARLDESGRAFDATMARLAAGRALAAAANGGAAAPLLERAAVEFERYRSERYRSEAERELRKLGRRIHRRTRPGTEDAGIAALTERELQLARLVVDRKTNTQIAKELFLSPKTVETHLRNIFRKVGVANRVELARAVEQAQTPR